MCRGLQSCNVAKFQYQGMKEPNTIVMTKLNADYTWEMPASLKISYKILPTCSLHFGYNNGRTFETTFGICTNGIFENLPILSTARCNVVAICSQPH